MDQMDIRARQLARQGEGKYLKAGRQAPAQTASGSGNMQAEQREKSANMPWLRRLWRRQLLVAYFA